MKKLFFTLVILSGFTSFAGNGSGTMMKFSVRAGNPIVFQTAETLDQVYFQFGTLTSANQWNMQKVVLPKDKLSNYPALFNALNESQQTKNWSAVK